MRHPKKSSEQNWLQGKVNWFDPKTGRGSILGKDGNLYRIQDFSIIELREKIKANAQVTFKLSLSSVHPIIETVRPVAKVQHKPRGREQSLPEKESVA